MTWIIVTIIVLLIIRAIYRSTGYYEVFVKVEYDSLKKDGNWLPMHTGTYSSCIGYIRHAKRNSTEQLGFRESFKIKRLKL